MLISQADKLRFEQGIELIPFTTCWIWNKAIRDTGYGSIAIKGKTWDTHRLSYTLYKGDIVKGQYIRHTCDNRACVNPEHLLSGTQKDNMEDKTSKNRQAKGSTVGTSKLTEEQVLEIRSKYIPHIYTTYDLAEEYGLAQSHIHRIISRESWQHV